MKDYQGESITPAKAERLHNYRSGKGYAWRGETRRGTVISYELDEEWEGSGKDMAIVRDLLPPQMFDTTFYPPIGAKMTLSAQSSGEVGDGESVIVDFEVTKHEWEFDWHIYAQTMYLTISLRPVSKPVEPTKKRDVDFETSSETEKEDYGK